MKFEKYHGLGNDFVIVDYKELDENENLEKLAVKICNRFTGIGSDGLVIAGTKTNPHQMTFIDPSGYRDKMCGNAIRCLSYFFKRQGYEKDQIEILTDDGLKIINIISKDPFVVEVNMQTFD
jgi:diaminopimelate epimerase